MQHNIINMNKKELNRQIRLKHKKEKEIEENPNLCFCDDPDYDEKQPIGNTEKIYYSIYDYNRESPFSLPIYRCNKCGKKLTLPFAQA